MPIVLDKTIERDSDNTVNIETPYYELNTKASNLVEDVVDHVEAQVATLETFLNDLTDDAQTAASTATTQAGIATTKASEASASAASVNANNIVHAPNSGLPNEAGTAYDKDVTTSSTDTTAGRLLKVGDFGVGAVSVGLISDDLAIVRPTGFYRYTQSILNRPGVDNSPGIIQWANRDDGKASAIAITDAEKMFFGNKASENTISWQEIYHTGLSDISRTGTQTVGTQDASNFTVKTNDATRASVTSSGNVLIGTTTDNGVDKLQVLGRLSANGNSGIIKAERRFTSKDSEDWSQTIGDSNTDKLYVLNRGSTFLVTVRCQSGALATAPRCASYIVSSNSGTTSGMSITTLGGDTAAFNVTLESNSTSELTVRVSILDSSRAYGSVNAISIL
jgi:hypothetical protein